MSCVSRATRLRGSQTSCARLHNPRSPDRGHFSHSAIKSPPRTVPRGWCHTGTGCTQYRKRFLGVLPDAQTLLFEYPAAFPAGPYLRTVVKIKLGARSDTDPSATPEIQPYLAEALPGELGPSTFSVRTVAPERTFWEKAMLLHEETFREGAGPKARLARHYYDLWCLIRAGMVEKALADPTLFSRIVAHRIVYFRKNKEITESLKPGSLRLLPAANHRAAWAQDYATMRETMFFGNAPEFDEILRADGEFEQRFNRSGSRNVKQS